MWCDNSATCSGLPEPQFSECKYGSMIYLPSQGQVQTQATRTVIDMHAKPCLAPGGPCSATADATTPARYTFSYIWDFLVYRGLTNNLVMFGETWSNSTAGCNGINFNDTSLTTETIAGYTQSCLSGANDFLCTQYGYSPNPNPGNVVFRPWGNVTSPASICEAPLKIGAPTGPFVN